MRFALAYHRNHPPLPPPQMLRPSASPPPLILRPPHIHPFIHPPPLADEDSLLLQLVSLHGPSSWSTIAAELPGRVGKQCRERWHNHLSPDVKKETFSEEEDRLILEVPYP